MVRNADEIKYVIIGNSAGGIGAAEAIREVDGDGSVLIISDEPYPAYSRPLISEYLVERCPLERMPFRPPDFYDKNHIRTLLGSRVVRLDAAGHTVHLEDGSQIKWGKLLLATGGSPILPRIKGINRSGVFTFTTLDDARAIDQFLNRFGSRKSRAVVVGGGLIGVSVTEALVKRGIKVTIVEMKERILNTILDEVASSLEEAALRQAGVNIITGHTASEVSSYWEDATSSVILDDGEPVPCNLVVMAIGVRPRSELTADTGIRAKRGIAVDRHMETSQPGVYACGDVAEAYDFVSGGNSLTPIWPNAYLGGRVAGFNMAGIPREYPGGTAMNSLKYFDLTAVSAGVVSPPGGGYEVLSEKSDHAYRKVVLKDGVVVGMVFVGNIEKSGIVFGLMRDRVNVAGFKHKLVAEDFSLACLPEEIWRPHLRAPASDLAPAVSSEPLEVATIGD